MRAILVPFHGIIITEQHTLQHYSTTAWHWPNTVTDIQKVTGYIHCCRGQNPRVSMEKIQNVGRFWCVCSAHIIFNEYLSSEGPKHPWSYAHVYSCHRLFVFDGPVWGRGTPLSPLSIYFFIFSPFTFPFLSWAALLIFFFCPSLPFLIYQNSPTPFPGRRS